VFRTIMVASDGRETSYGVMVAARDLALALGSRVVAIHVVRVTVVRGALVPASDEADLQRMVANQVRDLRLHGIDAVLRVRTRVATPLPRLIAESAVLEGADLIITGTDRGGPILWPFRSRLATALRRLSDRPVLTVPSTSPQGLPTGAG